MNPLTTVLIVVSLCAIIGAIVAVVAWRKATVRATRLRAVNRELSGQLTQAYELPQVASRLGVLHHVALVFNPAKAAADQARPLVAQACALFGLPEPKFYETDPEDSGYAAKDGAQLVVIAGGDGTVRAAAKVLYNSDVQMGIIPTGTGNLLARNLNLPINDVHSCISIAFNGQSRAVDVVSLDMLHDDNTWDNQVSVVIAGAGYDAQIMHSTSDRLKAAAGWLAYTEAGVRHLRGKRHSVTVSSDGMEPKRYRVRSAMIANCGYLTGGINMLPDALIDDGLLDVALLDPRHLVDWIQVASATLTAKRKSPRVTTLQARTCRMVFEEPLVAQIDGDPIPQIKEVEATTIPLSLRVRVPVEPSADED